MSHGRGMRSSEEGAVLLTGGNGTLSVCWVAGADIGNDRGSGTLTGSGVSSIRTGGLYCSIDEYSCRCDPQGTKGSGGDVAQGGSTSGGLGGIVNRTNGKGSTGGGLGEKGIVTKGDGSTNNGMAGVIGGNGMTSLGKDEDGWIKGQMTGAGPTGGNGAMAGADSSGAVTGADNGASGMVVIDPPPPPEGVGLDMNTGDLLLIVLLQSLGVSGVL